MFSDWTPTGTRDTNIDFDIESTPLQIQTDSVLGSGDVMRVRFVDVSIDNSIGVRITFSDPPTYGVADCETGTSFNLPDKEMYRIWTFKKLDGTLQLLCNGLEVFNFNYTDSTTNGDCSDNWPDNFSHIKFASGPGVSDTASDIYREFRSGKV